MLKRFFVFKERYYIGGGETKEDFAIKDVPTDLKKTTVLSIGALAKEMERLRKESPEGILIETLSSDNITAAASLEPCLCMPLTREEMTRLL